MAARKKTPDILGDVLGGRPASSAVSVKTAPGKTVKQNTGTPVKQHTIETLTEAVNGDDDDKIKVTFYISSEAYESLEQTWLLLRKMASPQDRRSVSKSMIADMAIKVAAKEVADKGAQSQFAGRMIKK